MSDGSSPAERAAGALPAGAGAPAGAAWRVPPLSAYVPRLGLRWLAESPGERHRSIEGTLAFVDVSGFTALTERLAARGRAGAEEITDIVGGTFSHLAAIAALDGADLLKWGGDAALLLFDGPDSHVRAARSAWRMVQAMGRIGRLRTSAGPVSLQVSVGVHSGTFELYLLGSLHRELVLAGPGATSTAGMEAIAAAGEVVVSPATASRLEAAGQADVVGKRKDAGFLLRGEANPARELPAVSLRRAEMDEAAGLLLPGAARRHLLAGGERAEHRPVAVGFVQLSGVDALVERDAAGAAEVLDPIVQRAQEAAERHGAVLLATDLAVDGTKVILLGGVPSVHGDDADRLLRCALDIVRPPLPEPASRVSLRAGVNSGKVFVFRHDLGLGGRHLFSVTGDAVNLAARVVAAAEPGEVRCTDAARRALRSRFTLAECPPFRAKGKSAPVVTFAVGEAVGGDPAALQRWRAVERLPLLGRDAELATLLEAAAAVQAGGAGRVVEIAGAAGIGKSRLVDEAVAGWRMPTGRIAGDAFGAARPYRALRPFARRLLMLDDDAPDGTVERALRATLERHAPALLAWAPLLGDVLDVAMPATVEVAELEPRFRRRRLESAVVELLGRLLTDPTALVFEDVHSLDEASASLALRIAEEAPARPWLVVATRRSEGAGVPPGALEGRTVIELEPLEAAVAAQLLGGLAAEVLRPNERQALVARAEGNPLFLLELGRAALSSGSGEDVPESIEPLLAAEVDRLEPSDRMVLRTAAVLGVHVDESLLKEIADDPQLVDGAAWSRLGELLVPAAGGLAFRHAMLREAAYEGLSFRRRRELHARAAAAIEARALRIDDAAELLALHWLAAERFEPAWRCARVAAERAVALSAYRDAATHLRRAVEAVRHLPGLERREAVQTFELLGDVCDRSSAYDHARRAYEAARRRSRDPIDRARLLRKLGQLHSRRGRYAAALRCFTIASRQLSGEDSATASERAFVYKAIAIARHRQGRLHDAMEAAERAEQEAERAEDRRALADALTDQHLNSVFLNEARDELGLRALAIWIELGDLASQAIVQSNLGLSAIMRGDWDLAEHHYESARETQSRVGDDVEVALADLNVGEILSSQGRLEQAEQRLLAARGALRAASFRLGEAAATMNLGRLELRRGRHGAAEALFQEALAQFEQIHADAYAAECAQQLAECALGLGALGGAAADSEALAKRWRGQSGYERVVAAALRAAGVARMRLGELQAAQHLLDESVAASRSLGERFELAQSLVARASLGRIAGDAPGASPAGDAPGASPAGDEREAAALFDVLGVLPAARLLFAWPSRP